MVGVIGKAIKGFGKALKSRGRKPGVFDKVIGKGVVDRNVKSKEVFKTIQGLRKKPYKKVKAFGKGALIGGAAVSGLEYKRRKDRGDYKKGKK